MTTSKKAKIISLEGNDGVGKSTQAARLQKILERSGRKAVSVKLPAYDTFVGKVIRRMLDDGGASKHPNLFQVAQWLDKVLFQFFELRKLARAHDYIILDRWHASMWAYGLSSGANKWLTNVAVDTLHEPDVVLIFRGTCKRGGARDTYEANSTLQKDVALHYELWSCCHDNAIAIDADRPLDEVTDEALKAITLFT